MIIGAGICGLSTAYYLAKQGRKGESLTTMIGGALVSPHSRSTDHAELETLSVVAPRASVLNRLSLVKA